MALFKSNTLEFLQQTMNTHTKWDKADSNLMFVQGRLCLLLSLGVKLKNQPTKTVFKHYVPDTLPTLTLNIKCSASGLSGILMTV